MEQSNSYGATVIVEQWIRDGRAVEQSWWNRGRAMVEQLKRDGGTVEQ